MISAWAELKKESNRFSVQRRRNRADVQRRIQLRPVIAASADWMSVTIKRINAGLHHRVSRAPVPSPRTSVHIVVIWSIERKKKTGNGPCRLRAVYKLFQTPFKRFQGSRPFGLRAVSTRPRRCSGQAHFTRHDPAIELLGAACRQASPIHRMRWIGAQDFHAFKLAPHSIGKSWLGKTSRSIKT